MYFIIHVVRQQKEGTVLLFQYTHTCVVPGTHDIHVVKNKHVEGSTPLVHYTFYYIHTRINPNYW
jgi:hypothetical protein